MQWKKNWEQFMLLMWNNRRQQYKLWKGTSSVVFYPFFLCFLLTILRAVLPSNFIPYPSLYQSFTVSDLSSRLVPPADGIPWHLAYTPDTAVTRRIMKRAVGVFNMTDFAFDNEDHLVEHLRTTNNAFGGIVFLVDNDRNLPRNITYKIRLRAEKSTALLNRDESLSKSGYYSEGFLSLQQSVDLSIIKEVNQNFDVNRFELRLKQYPYPPHNEDFFVKSLYHLLSVFIMLGFMTTARSLCKDILLEKEKKLKESMKLMGMKSWIHWCSWFVKSATIVTLSAVLTSFPLFMKTANGAVISYSFSAVLILLLLYSLALVTFVIAVSTLFSRAYTGSVGVFIIFFLSCLPYAIIDVNWSVAIKMAVSLDFNMALVFGCNLISQYEGIGVGVQFSNLAQPFGVDDSWTMLHVFGMLTVDIILYAIIAWYLDAVMPGEVGTSQPFTFPFMRSYWFGHSSVAENYDDNDMGCMSGLCASDKEEHFEKPMTDAKVGIRIRGLTKKYGGNATPAVNNLNIDMYEGNITALVGQNGAGKTTTMFILTGFLPPTDGSAYINGMNIKYEMERIRENIGLCPQHDILFDWLTVRQHLTFFAQLKGCSSFEAEGKATEMLHMLHLEDKGNECALNLSGGLKRKLCVGIALIGDSKFVILDEPTSGMDPEARRQIWDLLQSQQRTRTIILSTHCMDEADQLGDRIAIMADGQIQCYGTPMFLKNKFGIGYHLTILRNAKCDVNYLTEIIKSHVPDARLETSVGAEVSFVLPRDQSHKFEELFARLEQDQKKLGIGSFGASVTTMEEVFLRVGQTVGLEIDREFQDSNEMSVLVGGQDSAFGIEFRNGTGSKQNYLPLLGLLAKRIICIARSWISILILLMFCIAFILYALRDFITSQEIKDRPPVYLNLSHFTDPITPFEVVHQFLYDDESTKIANCYAEVAGVGGSVVDLSMESDTVGSYLLSVATSSMVKYNTKYLTGATVEAGLYNNTTITGWFNNANDHLIAISLSQVTNTLMRCFGQKEFHIQTINHSLPWVHNGQDDDLDERTLQRMKNVVFLLPYAIQMFIFVFPRSVIMERTTGSKHVQLVSGANVFSFWLATFLWDFLLFLIPAAVTIVILESVHFSPYTEGGAIWFVILNFVLYGFSILPFVYVLSFIFQVPSTGSAWISNIIFLSSVVSIFVPLIVRLYNSTAANALEWLFYVTLPNFCFEKAFRDFIPLYEDHRSCSRIGDQFNQSIACLSGTVSNEMNQCCSGTISYVAWEYPGIGRSLFFMALQSVILFVILILIEVNSISFSLPNWSRIRGKTEIKNEEVELGCLLTVTHDSDVVSERDRVLKTPINDLSNVDLIVVQALTKVFDEFIAVDDLSLGISHGECFGLLGVNGAGKTTCFKILTGELKPSFGKAIVGGRSVWENGHKVLPYIGYCPQSDSLLEELTVRETVRIFALIRGVPDGTRNQVVDAMINQLLLKDYAGKLVKTLSGGNKRKLSVAIAMIGDPQIIFLDEPTTGMDPMTKRIVWNTLIAARRSGRTLILTSHSMEECEALCTRIAIMVNGRFQCLGSIQHLKDKFTEGYSLIIKIRGANNTEEGQTKVNQIKSFVNYTFPGSYLKDHHEGMLVYQIQTPNLSWSQIFGTIERAKNNHLEIEDYSVSQTTLEQVFISFARMQRAAAYYE